MPNALRPLLVAVALLAATFAWQRIAEAVPSDTTADRVFGQGGGFITGACDLSGVDAASLCLASGLAVDSAGNLYVSDEANNRVLEFNTPMTTDTIADRVYGQAGDFTSEICNSGGISATSLCGPSGLALDGAGNLYVAGSSNSRVLRFNAPLTDATADEVYGQAGFIAGDCNEGATPTATRLCVPLAVALDAAGNLYVADYSNHRVLEYDTPLSTAMAADRVFGQGGSFTSGACNAGGLGAGSLCTPYGVAVQPGGNLFVADYSNSRVLGYDNPLTTNTVADVVVGQANFTTGACDSGGAGAARLCSPTGVTFDAAGDMYVSDGLNHRVLEYTPPIATNMAAGRAFGQATLTSVGCNNGGVSASSLCGPQPLAVDAGGDLYIGGYDNSRVLEYDVASTGCPGDYDCDGTPDVSDADDDNDGVADASDNCQFANNPSQLNSDSASLDGEAPLNSGTINPGSDATNPHADAQGDACDADDDNDGLADASEPAGCNASGLLSPTNFDSDSDLFPDGYECSQGTNPGLATSRPRIPRAAPTVTATAC